MKNYKLEFLYDNGVIETYQTGDVSEAKLENIINVVYQSFYQGLDAVLQLPNEHGMNSFINVRKVARVSVIK